MQLFENASSAVALGHIPELPRRGGDRSNVGSRLEGWIVGTLGCADPQHSPILSNDGLDKFLKNRLVERATSQNTSLRPSPNTGWYHFRLKRGTNILVVTLTDKSLLKEQDLTELENDLAALIEAGHRRVIMNFAFVQRMTSWAGQTTVKMMHLCQTFRGGTLRICGLTSDLAILFEITNLEQSLSIHDDEISATLMPWPELPELFPLPIEVISTLCKQPNRGSLFDPFGERMTSMRLERKNDAPDKLEGTSTVKLTIKRGTSQEKSIVLNGERFLIGRDPSCHLRPRSPYVSRIHALLERRGDQLFLSDLGSSNGTLCNCQVVEKEEKIELSNLDIIQIGTFTFIVEIGCDSLLNRFDEKSSELIDVAGTGHPDLRQTLDYERVDDSEAARSPKVEMIEETLIVTPLTTELDSETAVDLLRECLFGLIDRVSCSRWVLNLTHIGHMSGRSIGVVIAHHLNLAQKGGTLRICEVNPRVAVMLDHLKLGLLIESYETLDDAVLSQWPTF